MEFLAGAFGKSLGEMGTGPGPQSRQRHTHRDYLVCMQSICPVNYFARKPIIRAFSVNIKNDTTYPRLGSQVGLIYRQWRKILDARLKTFGVTDASWMPLITLARAGRPLRQKELAERLSLDTSSMVRVLEKLRAERLIDWSVDPDDRRAKAISLTLQGQQLVASIEGYSRALEGEVLAGIAPEDVATTREVLNRIANNIVQITNKV
ncbi:MarR family winged helix-turn-helix transcriptional regulator [Pseudomonas sp. A-R-19]|uniref:MarR family winged helix-turn-helix transcriptional regulator n=1 Tax=Pseudomonas sp. A-R-19 TaxID=2832403 RepID=UPI001CBCF209|nr:MarR family transcriptional regulator [Pseudomonas sp. A-R-19]